VSNAAIRGDSYTEGCLGQTGEYLCHSRSLRSAAKSNCAASVLLDTSSEPWSSKNDSVIRSDALIAANAVDCHIRYNSCELCDQYC